MTVDARGLSLTGSAEAVTAYDQAIDHLIRFQSEVVDAAAAAVAADPGCVMARVFCAYLALMSTEEHAVAGAIDALEGLDSESADLGHAAPRASASRRCRTVDRRRHGLGGRDSRPDLDRVSP